MGLSLISQIYDYHIFLILLHHKYYQIIQAKEKKSPADTSILDDEGVEMMIQERNLIESELRLEFINSHINTK